VRGADKVCRTSRPKRKSSIRPHPLAPLTTTASCWAVWISQVGISTVLEDLPEVRSALRLRCSHRRLDERRCHGGMTRAHGARGLRTQGTVCFDQLFTGIHHLFPTLVVRQCSRSRRLPQTKVCSASVGLPSEIHTTVRRGPVQSSRVFTDHRVVGDAKPAELDSEINQGTARSIFRRVLRGMKLKPVRSRASRSHSEPARLGWVPAMQPGCRAAAKVELPSQRSVTPRIRIGTAAPRPTVRVVPSNAPHELHSGSHRPQPDDHLASP